MQPVHEPATPYRDRAAERRGETAEFGKTKDHKAHPPFTNDFQNNTPEEVKAIDFTKIDRLDKKFERKLNVGIEAGSSELGGLVSKAFFAPHPHHLNFDKFLDNLYIKICKGFVFNKTSKDIFKRNKVYVFDNNVSNYTCGDSWTQGINPYPDQSIIKELEEALLWHQENRKKPIDERLPTESRLEAKKKESQTQDNDEDEDIFTIKPSQPPTASLNQEVCPEEQQTPPSAQEGVGNPGSRWDTIPFMKDEEDSDGTECNIITKYKPILRRSALRTDKLLIEDDYMDEMEDEDDDDFIKRKKKRTRNELKEVRKLISEKRVTSLDELEKRGGNSRNPPVTT